VNVAVARLDASRRDDFFALHAGLWCCCVGWHVPTWDGWTDRTEAENRALRERLFARGEDDGYLLYLDRAPAGWCQAGPRDRLPKLVATYGLAPAPGTWAITCFLVAHAHRGKGLARLLLAGVLDDLAARGVARVEAFPKREAREPGELWNGPETLFREAGFSPVGVAVRGPILAKAL
jgi:GNAT superfamily N-acetyltransferase